MRPFLVVIVAAVLAVFAVPANAEVSLTSAYPNWAAASYKGWGYVSNGDSITSWKWSTTGWLKSSFAPGDTAWIHPYSGTWSWAYRNKEWYAVKTQAIATWSCVGPADKATVSRKTAAYSRNLQSDATTLGYLGSGTEVVLNCENLFASATIGRDTVFIMAPEGYALVMADPQVGCLVPDYPNAPVCKIYVRPRPPQPVYVLAKDLQL